MATNWDSSCLAPHIPSGFLAQVVGTSTSVNFIYFDANYNNYHFLLSTQSYHHTRGNNPDLTLLRFGV